MLKVTHRPVFLFVLALTLFIGGKGWADIYLVDFDESRAEHLMLEAINKIRYQHGLPLVTLDDQLSAVCRHHAVDMAERDYFDHFSPEGLSPDDRAARAGLPYDVTENIGIIRTFGQDLRSVVGALMGGFLSSPDHLANILDPKVTHVGIGLYQDLDGRNHRLTAGSDDDGVYTGFGSVLVVQDFCRRRVRLIEPRLFCGEAVEGEFLELRLDFTDEVGEAFLRIIPELNPKEAFEVPLMRDREGYRARFRFEKEGHFTIAIYASAPSEDWFYREQGRLELMVTSPGL
jgi:hypothetical protein